MKPFRRPGLLQACILLVGAGLSSLATAVLGPSLPKMQAHFASTPDAEYLVPLSLTAPMLVMACMSVFVSRPTSSGASVSSLPRPQQL